MYSACSTTMNAVLGSTHLHKKAPYKIDHETLLWDNFMYSACSTTMNAVLGSTHLHKKAPYKIDHETLLWDNFMYSALFYTLCRSALFLAPPT